MKKITNCEIIVWTNSNAPKSIAELILLVFIFSKIISTISKKLPSNSIEITKLFRKSFAEFPQNFCGRKKTKLAWVLGSVISGKSTPIKSTSPDYFVRPTICPFVLYNSWRCTLCSCRTARLAWRLTTWLAPCPPTRPATPGWPRSQEPSCWIVDKWKFSDFEPGTAF